jgi:hypothetical protein
MITQEWLVDNLGQPSGKWGSTYTKIHKKTGEYERTPTLALLEQLIELVNDFSWSAHKGAKTDEQREAKALDAIRLNQFLVALKTERLGAYGLNSNYTPATLAARIKKGDTQYATEKAMVQSVIAEMQQSSSPIIRNTGIGCASSDVTLSMIWHASRSGSMSLNGLRSTRDADRNTNRGFGGAMPRVDIQVSFRRQCAWAALATASILLTLASGVVPLVAGIDRGGSPIIASCDAP